MTQIASRLCLFANGGDVGTAMIVTAVLVGIELAVLTHYVSPSALVRVCAMFFGALGAFGAYLLVLLYSDVNSFLGFLLVGTSFMMLMAGLFVGIIAVFRRCILR